MNTGDSVYYVPLHAAGDLQHPDVERGVVTSLGSLYVFVRFDSQPADTPGKACDVTDLVLINQPEGGRGE